MPRYYRVMPGYISPRPCLISRGRNLVIRSPKTGHAFEKTEISNSDIWTPKKMKFPETGHEGEDMVKLCTGKGGVNAKEEMKNAQWRSKAGSRSPSKYSE